MVRTVSSPDSQESSAGHSRARSAADTKGKRRAARIDSDDDEAIPDATQDFANTQESYVVEEDRKDDDEGGDNAEDEEGSPKGRKRARANTHGDAHASQVDVKGKMKEEVKTLPRDDDGYIPGSLVRVQLKNFVTYDWVEFTPGPYLNMILGPNGTGKSSIACAICLGLNFPPSVLGRASELNSFVKIGAETGHIEIELKGAKGKPNLVIRRTLNARSKSNQFYINNKAASGREINEQMQKLNVQVSNLCSFLPQDKVAEFARMTPQQLLRETQRAAGNAHLTSWHDTLIEAGRELKQLQERMDTDKSQLQTMQERNTLLERDVKKYEERQQIEREIEFLDLIIPFKEYTETRERFNVAKATQRIKQQKAQKLKAKNAPIEKVIADMQAQQQRVEKQREQKKTAMKQQFSRMGAKWAESDSLEQEIEDIKERLDNLKKEEKGRQKRIENYKKEIAAIEDAIAHPPEVEDVEELTEQIRQRNVEIRKLKDKVDSVQQRIRDMISEESRHKGDVDHHARRLKELNDVDHQKLDRLMNWHRDTGETVRWLRANRNRFKMEIFEPAVLSMTVPDKRYANAIESQFSANDLQTFVAQCNEDYLLLNQLVADTPEALGRKARINTWFKTPGQPSRQPASAEELQSLGFDGYAIDYVSCPEGMKWFLQNSANLHRTAVAVTSPGKVNAARAQDVLSRDGSINYIIGNTMNSVRRSRYGKRLAQNSTRDIGQARHLAAANADPALKRDAENGLNAAQHALQGVKEQIAALGKEEQQYRSEHNEKKAEQDEISKRRKASADKLKNWQGLSFKLGERQRAMQKLLDAPSVDQEREQLKQKILKLVKRRIDIIIQYERMIRQTITDQKESTRMGLQFLQIGANIEGVEKIFQVRKEEAAKALAEWQQADEEYRIAKAEVKHKLEVSKNKLDMASEATQERFNTMEESGEQDPRTSEQCHIELETLRAQLELNMNTNAGVVEQFRRRQAEIATLTETIEEREEKLSKLTAKITKTRGYWEPALVELVDSIGEKFSSAFDRIGCAGEIKIAQHEDYDKWAIDILVKFRDDEKLQLLTAERQSGGERSLTTILYLMSLTEHARAPFSLVDEINQGMDQRAERAVHNSLVDVTCKADSGQYFLITPKLLPDLNYHERMKVLCVNNGEWIPDTNLSGNMMGMIDNYLRHNRGTQ